MSIPGYEIVPYLPELAEQAVAVLQCLWNGSTSRNLSLLEWKYERNPCAERPLALVALHNGEAVAFRGYSANRYEIMGRTDRVLVLSPGDTVVHPEHRERGLSVAMGRLAMAEYASQYALFLNLSCNRRSLPGYLKMGFLPLEQKVYWTQSTARGLAEYLRAGHRAMPLEGAPVALGPAGSVWVSDQPRPVEMAALAAAYRREQGRLRLSQDDSFFSWRYSGGWRRYWFYYQMRDDSPVAYLVVSASMNARRGYIVDYAEEEPGGIEQLLRHMVRVRPFGVLSVYGFCADPALQQSLQRLGFSPYHPLRWFDKTAYGERPVLVRPVKAQPAEEDYRLHGVDVRHPESWTFKPICSDDA